MRKVMLALGLLVTGIFLGPLAFAALVSLASQTEEMGQPTAAMRLLQTFDNAFPQGIPNYSIDPDFLPRKCGYSEAEVLGEMSSDELRNRFSPYSGYFALRSWITHEFLSEVEEARVRQLQRHLSNFEIEFLNRCIANSGFSMVCGNRVRKVLEDGDLYSKYSLPSEMQLPDQAAQMTAMCRFLDGVAARKGQQLGRPNIESE